MPENLNPPPQVPPPADDLAELRALVRRQLQEINRLQVERDAADDACLRIANEAAQASKVRADTLAQILASVEECKQMTMRTAHQRDCCERALRSLVAVCVNIGKSEGREATYINSTRALQEAQELLTLIDQQKNK